MIEVAATTIASAHVVSQLVRQYLRLSDRDRSDRDKPITVRINDQDISLPGGSISPELLESLQRAVETERKSAPDPISLSREAIRGSPEFTPEVLNQSPQATVGRIALAISPEAVFRDARKRITFVFRLNLGLAITLAVILLGGIVGTLFPAVFYGENTWALVFGGISVGDVIGVYVFKPLKAINAALVATQRLDAIYLRLQQQLDACSQHSDLKERIRCQTKTWEAMQSELAALGESAGRV